MIFTFVIFCSN